MKVDMSPKAIENRLKLVGELTKACLLLRRQTSQKTQPLSHLKLSENKIAEKTRKQL